MPILPYPIPTTAPLVYTTDASGDSGRAAMWPKAQVEGSGEEGWRDGRIVNEYHTSDRYGGSRAFQAPRVFDRVRACPGWRGAGRRRRLAAVEHRRLMSLCYVSMRRSGLARLLASMKDTDT